MAGQVVHILADDVTGATDSSVTFADAGWEARLMLDEAGTAGEGGAPLTLARALNTRAMAAPAAEETTRRAAAAAMADGGARLYLKIDSTMRGSVPAQIRGALAALGAHGGERPFAVVCPAYPAMGRQVIGGRVLVHGTSLDLSPAGRDAVTPVTTADMRALLPGAVTLAPGTSADDLAARLISAAAGADIIAVDAATNDDLARIAGAVARIGTRALPVGSAGLASALARAWHPADAARRGADAAISPVTRPVVIAVTSLHQVTREQVAALSDACATDVRRLELTPAAISDPAHAHSAVQAAADAASPITLVLTPRERMDDMAGTRAADAVAHGVGRVVDELLQRMAAGALVIVGGDGALAILRALDASSVRIMRSVLEGVPIGRIMGGRADGLVTVTKSGGFGAQETLIDIVRRLRG